jgi:hypothetical protein
MKDVGKFYGHLDLVYYTAILYTYLFYGNVIYFVVILV